MKGIFSAAIFTDAEAISALLILVATVFTFLLVAAHTLIESGQIRFKNSHFQMMKNLLLTCIAVLMWWFTGYALAFGSPQKFIGNDGWHFASAGFEKMRVDNYLRFVYELAFCIVVCILFTGPLAERTRMVAYACYTFLLAGYIYPVIVAWVWGGGWLAQKGFHDFAGSGVVHIVAGTSGFWGAYFVGKRFGKDFHKNKLNYVLDHRAIEKIIAAQRMDEIPYSIRNLAYRDDFRPSNQVYIVFGTLMFWACYLFFNGGKAYTMYAVRANASAKIFENTFLSAASAGFTAFLLKPFFVKTYRHVSYYDGVSTMNGILSGLVAVSAGCDRYEPWAAFVVGIIAALFYIGWCKVLWAMKVDDATEGSAIHMSAGIWGLMAVGFFDNSFGVFYSDPAKGRYFGYQILGIVVIVLWTSVHAITYFLVMKTFNMLRVDMCYEIVGIDALEMGGVNALDLLKIHEELRYRLANDEKKEKEMMLKSEQNNLARVNEVKTLLRRVVA